MANVLIIGATSAIAEATARRFAAAGDRLFLTGRREDRLRAISDDLRVRGGSAVEWRVLDINDLDRQATIVVDAVAMLGKIDIALIAHGTLPDQRKCQQSVELTVEELRTNAVSTIALLTRVALVLEEQRGGTIAVITSVAGDRGRESNYVYGAAKAAVDAFLEGLRQRLHKVGVRVTTIKPGFVDTPMTASFDKGFLWAQPDQVAARIHHALTRGADVVYVPAFWRPIMMAIRTMPRQVFKRLSL